jgi:hypothetical protein
VGGCLKRQEFRFYPPDWDGSRWVSFDGWVILPHQPACYVIYLDGELSYIGQTTDLSKRIAGHGIRIGYGSGYITNDWGYYDNVVIKARFSTRFGDWAMRELRLIARLQPRLNCVGSTRRRVAA